MCGAYKIYPTEQGGILFEFESNGWDFSVELDNVGAVEMYGIQVEGGRGEMEPVTFDEVGDQFMMEGQTARQREAVHCRSENRRIAIESFFLRRPCSSLSNFDLFYGEML